MEVRLVFDPSWSLDRTIKELDKVVGMFDYDQYQYVRGLLEQLQDAYSASEWAMESTVHRVKDVR